MELGCHGHLVPEHFSVLEVRGAPEKPGPAGLALLFISYLQNGCRSLPLQIFTSFHSVDFFITSYFSTAFDPNCTPTISRAKGVQDATVRVRGTLNLHQQTSDNRVSSPDL